MGFDDTTDKLHNTTWGAIRIQHNPSKQYVDFKAFVKTLQDSVDGGWKVDSGNSQQTIPTARQSVPKRTISIDFSVPAGSKDEGLDNLMKCSFMYQAIYPSLKVGTNTNHLASSFWTLKFANLIANPDGSGLLGFCDGFTFIPNMEEGSWIHRATNEHLIIPKLIDVKLKFTPFVLLSSHAFMVSATGQTGKATKAAWANTKYPYQMDFGQPGTTTDDKLTGTAVGKESTSLKGRLKSILGSSY